MSELKKNSTPRSTPPDPRKNNPDPEKKRLIGLFLIPILFFVFLHIFIWPNIEVQKIPYSEFFQMAQRNTESGEIASAEMEEDVIRGKLRTGSYFQTTIPDNDPELIPLLRRNVQNFN